MGISEHLWELDEVLINYCGIDPDFDNMENINIFHETNINCVQSIQIVL